MGMLDEKTRFQFEWETKSDTFRWACRDILCGVPIIIVDDFERENEGDLMIAGERATLHNLAYMAKNGRGIMCLPCEGAILDQLDIPMMVPPEPLVCLSLTALKLSR
jgi:3,4-dihydroxy 2-butanone 4-phosphate synthase/GTP cyclohydrolase II